MPCERSAAQEHRRSPLQEMQAAQIERAERSAASDLAHDISSERDPLDWYIEVCGVCGCQLGPGVGTRTRTGRCIYESHRSVGGIVVRVAAKPLSEQERKFPVLARLGVPDA